MLYICLYANICLSPRPQHSASRPLAPSTDLVCLQYLMKAACTWELDKFCKDISHGNATVIRCLQVSPRLCIARIRKARICNRLFQLAEIQRFRQGL